MSASTEEQEWDLESYLNTAIEAATAGKGLACCYFIRQAKVSARILGWDKNRERVAAVVAECAALLEDE